MMTPGTVLKIAAGSIIAAVGVYVFQSQVDLHDIAFQIKSIALWKIVAVVAMQPATLYFRALRWSIILPDRDSTNKRTLFSIVTIGFMVNNFIPARIGEAVRGVLLWRRNGFSIAESAGSIALERFFDILFFALFLCVPIFVLPELATFRSYASIIAAGVLLTLLFFALYAKKPVFVKKTAKRITVCLPHTIQIIVNKVGREILSNADWMFFPKKAVWFIVLSIMMLSCQVGMIATLGYGINGFTLFVSIFGVACAAVGAAIPLSPGYVGTLHSALLGGLVSAGISTKSAGTIAVLYHAIGYVTISIIGLINYFRLKITIADLRHGH